MARLRTECGAAGLSAGRFGAAVGSSAERPKIRRGRLSSSFLARVPR